MQLYIHKKAAHKILDLLLFPDAEREWDEKYVEDLRGKDFTVDRTLIHYMKEVNRRINDQPYTSETTYEDFELHLEDDWCEQSWQKIVYDLSRMVGGAPTEPNTKATRKARADAEAAANAEAKAKRAEKKLKKAA